MREHEGSATLAEEVQFDDWFSCLIYKLPSCYSDWAKQAPYTRYEIFGAVLHKRNVACCALVDLVCKFHAQLLRQLLHKLDCLFFVALVVVLQGLPEVIVKLSADLVLLLDVLEKS